MAGLNEKDYYAVLEVEETASAEEIRKAFQKKAVKLHPDVNKEPDAEERFKEVSEAYAVLSDPEKRARYDQMRANPFAGSYGSPSTGGDPFAGFGGFPFGSWTSTRTTTRRSRSYNPRAGADVVYQLNLSEDQAAEGVRRAVTYQRYGTCASCGGSGSAASGHPETCPMCHGSGHIAVDVGTLFGIGVMTMVCPECEGSGKVVAEPCEACGGSGRTLSATEAVVEVPADSHDGDEVRVANAGNAGTNGSSAGDFVARVVVPTERLDARQAYGFRAIGFGLPFLAISILSGGGIFVPLLVMGFGLFLVLTSDLAGRGRYWWRNAGLSLLAGISSAIPFAVFLLVMNLCSAATYARLTR